MEFLGDSVLELAIAKELYDRYPDASEGRLAKIRSHVVSRQSCAAVARELRLGERLGEAAGEVLAGDELSRIVKSRNVTRGAARGRDRRALPRARLPADRVGDRRCVLRSDRVRTHDPRRPQDRAPRSARKVGSKRHVRGARRGRSGPRAPFLLRRSDRRRGARHGPRAYEEGGRAGRGKGGSGGDRSRALDAPGRPPPRLASLPCTCVLSACAASSRSPTPSS